MGTVISPGKGCTHNPTDVQLWSNHRRSSRPCMRSYRLFISYCASLISVRLLLATISTLTFSLPTAKPDTSIARLTGSEQTLVHWTCLGLVKRFERLENPQQAGGQGIDQLRKQEIHANCSIKRLRLGSSSNTHTDRTGIEHFQMHFNVLHTFPEGLCLYKRLISK